MADDDVDNDFECSTCNQGFNDFRSLRQHETHSLLCGKKRKLDEVIDDDTENGGDSDGRDGATKKAILISYLRELLKKACAFTIVKYAVQIVCRGLRNG